MPKIAAEMEKYLSATEAYLKNLEATGATEQTIKNYSSRLNSFYEFMINNGFSQKGPCFTAVQAWRNDLMQHLKPSSIHQYLIELRMFFSWASDPELCEQQWYSFNPVAKTLFPDLRKASKRPYSEFLTDTQVELLYVNTPVSDWRYKYNYWPRNYAVVILALTTELRTSEMLDLTLLDLDFEHEEIIVRHGKGDKFRIVEFPFIAQTAIKLYLNSGLRPKDLPDSAPLFGTTGNPATEHGRENAPWKKGTRQWLTNLIKRHVLSVTGVPNISAHDLRHVGARLDLNNGMRIEELQSKLGHERINTTQIYSGKLLPQRKRQNVEKTYDNREIQAIRNLEMLLSSKAV